jgi:hypothetical protein
MPVPINLSPKKFLRGIKTPLKHELIPPRNKNSPEARINSSEE